MKKLICMLMATLLLAGCSTGVSRESYDSAQAEYDALSVEHDALRADYDALKTQHDDLVTQYDALQGKFDALSAEYQQYQEETADFSKLSEAEKAAEIARAEEERIKAEEDARKAKEEAEAAEAERLAKEQEEARKAEEERLAEEAKGYETGITYKQLSRTPDQYEGQKVKFTGRVLQVLEGTDYNSIRMSTSGRYDNVVYGVYSPTLLNVRLLEEDKITIYGVSRGLYTYETVMGGTVTLPLINIDRIEIK